MCNSVCSYCEFLSAWIVDTVEHDTAAYVGYGCCTVVVLIDVCCDDSWLKSEVEFVESECIAHLCGR